MKVGQGTDKKMGIKLWNKWLGEGTSEKENILTAFPPSAAYCTNTESLSFRRKLSGILLSIHEVTGTLYGARRRSVTKKWTYRHNENRNAYRLLEQTSLTE
jgi:hypothetical protein